MGRLFETYTAFCMDEKGNTIKTEGIHVPHREETVLYLKDFNRNFRVLALLTKEEIRQLRNALNVQEQNHD